VNDFDSHSRSLELSLILSAIYHILVTTTLCHSLAVSETLVADDKLSLIGAWSGHVTHYKILGAPIISLERLNLKSSNFVHE